MNLGLADKRALIGGASKGLGLACAQALAAEGCAVALVSRSAENLRSALATLPPDAPHLAIEADLSSASGVDRCFSAAEAWGPIDILVNNTGGPPPGTSFSHDSEAWDRAYESLLVSVRRACEHFVPAMQKRGWGRVVTITSRTVKEPASHLVLSNVFRTAVTAYLKVLAREVAASGVTVNTVLPGAFRTARYEQLIADMAQRRGTSTAQVAEEIIQGLPQRRFQRPDELGALVAFLCSEQASSITGAGIPVDGGALLGLLS